MTTQVKYIRDSEDFTESKRAIVRKPTLLSSSNGKDNAWALPVLRQDSALDVVVLFSVMSERHDRLSMHSKRAGSPPLRPARLPDWTVAAPGGRTGSFQNASSLIAPACEGLGQRMQIVQEMAAKVREAEGNRLASSGPRSAAPTWETGSGWKPGY